MYEEKHPNKIQTTEEGKVKYRKVAIATGNNQSKLQFQSGDIVKLNKTRGVKTTQFIRIAFFERNCHPKDLEKTLNTSSQGRVFGIELPEGE